MRDFYSLRQGEEIVCSVQLLDVPDDVGLITHVWTSSRENYRRRGYCSRRLTTTGAMCYCFGGL